MKRLLLISSLLLTSSALAQTPQPMVNVPAIAAVEKPLDELSEGFYACIKHRRTGEPPASKVTYDAGFETCPTIVAEFVAARNREKEASDKVDLEKINRAAKKIAK